MASIRKNTRSAQRAHAFQVLYGLVFSSATSLEDVAAAYRKTPERDEEDGQEKVPQGEPEGFAWELVKGVWENSTSLDAQLKALSQNWRIERMGKVEITLLRLALYEIGFRKDIPAKVAMNEAIELSKQFGDDNSRSFVNGILDAATKAAESEKKHS